MTECNIWQYGWSRRFNAPLSGRVVRVPSNDRRLNEDQEEFDRVQGKLSRTFSSWSKDPQHRSKDLPDDIPQWYKDFGYEVDSGDAFLIAVTRKGTLFPVILPQSGGKPSPQHLERLAKMEWRVMKAINHNEEDHAAVDDVDPECYGKLWAGEFDVKGNLESLLRCNGLLEFGVLAYHEHKPLHSVIIRGHDIQAGSFFLNSVGIGPIRDRSLTLSSHIFFGFIP